MSVSFAESKTKENLLRAFAGESQARNRYTFSAGFAKKQGLPCLEMVFLFTANQELAHAKAFYDYLKDFTGENIAIDGTYPVDIYPTIAQHLRAAQHNEMQEYEHDYASFAQTAKEEGFSEISYLFSQIARIEKVHGERFGQFADLVEQGKLFVSDVQCEWMCLNCGHILNVVRPPEKCPVCQHGQGYFVRLEMVPWQMKQ